MNHFQLHRVYRAAGLVPVLALRNEGFRDASVHQIFEELIKSMVRVTYNKYVMTRIVMNCFGQECANKTLSSSLS